MNERLRHLFIGWVWLMVLLAVELGASFLPLPRSARPLLLMIAALMAGVVGTVFMKRRGPKSFAFSSSALCSGLSFCWV
jgi:hypothetical protein